MLKGIFRGVINSVSCILLGVITGIAWLIWGMDKLGLINYERVGDYYYHWSKKK